MKEQIIKRILDEKIVVIVRGVARENLPLLFEAMYKGGIRFAEITFDPKENIPDGLVLSEISSLRAEFDGRMHIGAGTVLSARQAKDAISAGAEYIVSPCILPDVIDYCAENDTACIPGAMTPTEIVSAVKMGADIVKLFPCDFLGLNYIKTITEPLCNIPMLAVGRVDITNVAEYLKLLSGVAVGSAVIRRDLIAKGDFEGITENARLFCDIAKSSAQKL